jgi:hypothetical protein
MERNILSIDHLGLGFGYVVIGFGYIFTVVEGGVEIAKPADFEWKMGFDVFQLDGSRFWDVACSQVSL